MSKRLRPICSAASLPNSEQRLQNPFVESRDESSVPRVACTPCRKAKVKCNAQRPVCRRCLRLSLDCEYRTLRGETTHQAMTRKLDTLEEENKQLKFLLNQSRSLNEKYETAQGEPNEDDLTTTIRTSSSISGESGISTSSDIYPFFESLAPSAVHVAEQGPSEQHPKPSFAQFNRMMRKGSQLPSISSDFIEAIDEHLIAVIVLRGWDPARKEFLLDQQWNTVASMDEMSDYSSKGMVMERLASIYHIRTMLKYYTLNPESLESQTFLAQLSDFRRQRPIQQVTSHPAAVDYYLWPGFREFAICWPTKYCDDKFLEAALQYFRFKWPHDLEHAFTFDKSLGLVQLSQTFKDRVSDLNSWTLKMQFFDLYPELRGEAASYDESLSIYQPQGSTNCQANQPELVEM